MLKEEIMLCDMQEGIHFFMNIEDTFSKRRNQLFRNSDGL